MTSDLQTKGESMAVVSLAGIAAEKINLQRRGPVSRLAIHEAAHAVVALAYYSWFVGRATITPDETLRVGRSGHTFASGHVATHPQWAPEDKSKPVPRGERKPSKTDIRAAAEVCFLLAEPTRWRPALGVARAMRARTEEIVRLYWPEIVEVGSALDRDNTLTGEQIAAMSARWFLKQTSKTN